MKKRILDSIKTLVLVAVLVILTKMIAQLPWWSFVLPVLVLGVIITWRKWEVPAFAVGFLSGFIIWFGANLYFDITLNGIVLNKIGLLLAVPKIIVLLIAGVIGGLLTGLALYMGKSLFAPGKVSAPESKLA